MISSEQIEYMLVQRYRPSLLRQLLARGDCIFAARAGDQLVGFAHAYVTGEGHCKLDKHYVSTELQQHGIGAMLVKEVEQFARQQGPTDWCCASTSKMNQHWQPIKSALQNSVSCRR
jgi:predicted GNAT family acetyltransferase